MVCPRDLSWCLPLRMLSQRLKEGKRNIPWRKEKSRPRHRRSHKDRQVRSSPSYDSSFLITIKSWNCNEASKKNSSVETHNDNENSGIVSSVDRSTPDRLIDTVVVLDDSGLLTEISNTQWRHCSYHSTVLWSWCCSAISYGPIDKSFATFVFYELIELGSVPTIKHTTWSI